MGCDIVTKESELIEEKRYLPIKRGLVIDAAIQFDAKTAIKLGHLVHLYRFVGILSNGLVTVVESHDPSVPPGEYPLEELCK